MRKAVVASTPARLWAVLAALHLSGCFTHHRRPIAPQPLPDPVEVEVDGRALLLHGPRLEGDSILAGWEITSPSDSTFLRLPYRQEVRELDKTKTMLLALGIVTAAATVALVVLIDAMTSW